MRLEKLGVMLELAFTMKMDCCTGSGDQKGLQKEILGHVGNWYYHSSASKQCYVWLMMYP